MGNIKRIPKDASPTRKKYGTNGSIRVGRIMMTCLACKEPWSILYRKDQTLVETCPTCGSMRVRLESDHLNELSLEVLGA